METLQHVIMCECAPCEERRQVTRRMEAVMRRVAACARQHDREGGRLRNTVQMAMRAVCRARAGVLVGADTWEAFRQVVAGVLPPGSTAGGSGGGPAGGGTGTGSGGGTGDIGQRKAAKAMTVAVAELQDAVAARLAAWERDTAAEAARRRDEDEEWATHGEGAEMRRARREQARQERARRQAEQRHDRALQAMMEQEEALHAQLVAARRHRAGKVSMRTRAMGRYNTEETQVRKRRLWTTPSNGEGLRAGVRATMVGQMGECEWWNGTRVMLSRCTTTTAAYGSSRQRQVRNRWRDRKGCLQMRMRHGRAWTRGARDVGRRTRRRRRRRQATRAGRLRATRRAMPRVTAMV